MKVIKVDVDVDDALELLAFLHISIEMMRENTKGGDSIQDEILISVVERFNKNLNTSLVDQAHTKEIEEAIKYLRGK